MALVREEEDNACVVALRHEMGNIALFGDRTERSRHYCALFNRVDNDHRIYEGKIWDSFGVESSYSDPTPIKLPAFNGSFIERIYV